MCLRIYCEVVNHYQDIFVHLLLCSRWAKSIPISWKGEVVVMGWSGSRVVFVLSNHRHEVIHSIRTFRISACSCVHCIGECRWLLQFLPMFRLLKFEIFSVSFSFLSQFKRSYNSLAILAKFPIERWYTPRRYIIWRISPTVWGLTPFNFVTASVALGSIRYPFPEMIRPKEWHFVLK